jgi:hypothetical protein
VATERWRVPTVLPVLKLTGAAVLLAAGLLVGRPDAVGLAVGILVAAGLAAWATRDLVAAERLAADDDGVTVVSGYAGRRRIGWPQIERITVDSRTRRGLRSELLEIDTGESIHLLSRWDLGAPPKTWRPRCGVAPRRVDHDLTGHLSGGVVVRNLMINADRRTGVRRSGTRYGRGSGRSARRRRARSRHPARGCGASAAHTP